MSKSTFTHIYDKTKKDPKTTTRKKYGGFFASLAAARAWVKQNGTTARWHITDQQPYPKLESDPGTTARLSPASGELEAPSWSNLFGVDPDYTEGKSTEEFIEENRERARQVDEGLDKALKAVEKAQGGQDDDASRTPEVG